MPGLSAGYFRGRGAGVELASEYPVGSGFPATRRGCASSLERAGWVQPHIRLADQGALKSAEGRDDSTDSRLAGVAGEEWSERGGVS